MTFFADLSLNDYYIDDDWPEPLLSIGWLDGGHAYQMGDTSRKFQSELAELCKRPGWGHRGTHTCELCPVGRAFGRKYNFDILECGNGQIRLRGADGPWYAAPTMVHHYVVAHRYLPPREFIEAVLQPVAVGVDHYIFDADDLAPVGTPRVGFVAE